ncbi:G-patch-domain-containing protein [Coemansia reversa NRRL 1564]|uniref:G-patch-domain-containing protein n=1 Tax=Coemansia reversa (strain ATCC 12441 / NRRL 1564) TaxID=763665 RepID=A0A2G5B5R7_COERN|nr:G-patch-domain-containing protein [Coemansia reversa NRRL 1564]|eukprot:PIA14349.1 G-patch-domain-containing protein [Coemansia reversa NRRL 1564]
MGLSEQKNRVIYAPDPRNLGWSQDKNRFGFKMLEKMGWSEGKGLGANEDGLKEHVKIKLKTNNHGIGADKKTIRNWLANADGYSELLDRLNTELPTEESKKVEQPKNTEQVLNAANKQLGRLSHRAKFRRMKQMATKDVKGLQEIFGVRNTTVSTDLPTPQSAESGSGDEGDSSLRLTTATVNAGICVSDYFANKMANNPALAAVYSVQEASPSESDSAVAKSSKKRKPRDSGDVETDEKHRQKSKKTDKKEKKDKKKRRRVIGKPKPPKTRSALKKKDARIAKNKTKTSNHKSD